MRFDVNITLNDKEIPKDKNRMFLSFIKHNLSKNNKRCFEKLYGKGITCLLYTSPSPRDS